MVYIDHIVASIYRLHNYNFRQCSLCDPLQRTMQFDILDLRQRAYCLKMFENAGHLRVHLTTCTNGMFIIRNMLCVGS